MDAPPPAQKERWTLANKGSFCPICVFGDMLRQSLNFKKGILHLHFEFSHYERVLHSFFLTKESRKMIRFVTGGPCLHFFRGRR